MSKILISGGAGFIGSHLVDELIELGHSVIVVDNLSTGSRNNLNNKATFYECDIRNIKQIEQIFNSEKIDVVYHLAAQINLRKSLIDPINDTDINILGSLNMIQNSIEHNIKHFIFASTGGAIYSETDILPWQEFSECNPASPYGLNKLMVENYLKLFNKLYGLNYTILRLSNIFGTRQNHKSEAGCISIFIDNLLKNRKLTIFGSGKQTRDFLFVRDCVNAFILALDKLPLNHTWNVSTGKETSINEIVGYIYDLMHMKPDIFYDEPISGELMRSALSSKKIQYFGKWAINSSLEEGLKETIEYCRKNK